MVATAERVGKVARIGGWGGVWLIRAMPELKRFFCFALVPKGSITPPKRMNFWNFYESSRQIQEIYF